MKPLKYTIFSPNSPAYNASALFAGPLTYKAQGRLESFLEGNCPVGDGIDKHRISGIAVAGRSRVLAEQAGQAARRRL